MTNKKLKVSYQRQWDKGGYCYTQMVKIPKDLAPVINKEIQEAMDKKEHVTLTSSYNYIYLSTLSQTEKNFTKITTMDVVRHVLQNLGLDVSRVKHHRNTIVSFY